MELVSMTWANLETNTGSASGLFALARAQMTFEATGVVGQFSEVPSGFTLTGTVIGGDDSEQFATQPDFFPFATKGAECAMLSTSLQVIQDNLVDFEYITWQKAGVPQYLGFGVLNSTKTDFNDPFAGALKAACWAGINQPNIVG